jgi:hypothetical protein
MNQPNDLHRNLHQIQQSQTHYYGAPYGPPQPPAPEKANPTAFAAMVLAIIGVPLFCVTGGLLSLLGVILAHASWGQLSNDPKGKNFATAALAIGYPVLGLELIFAALYLISNSL